MFTLLTSMVVGRSLRNELVRSMAGFEQARITRPGYAIEYDFFEPRDLRPSLETKHLIQDFDILGITIPYETLYTNTLNLLDLSGIPIFSTERTEEHPLVIAGGHVMMKPEPACDQRQYNTTSHRPIR